MITNPYIDELHKLNNGEPVKTYEMKTVPPDREPITGEIRYIMPLAPMPGEELASMLLLYPLLIIWNGTKWIIADETASGKVARQR